VRLATARRAETEPAIHFRAAAGCDRPFTVPERSTLKDVEPAVINGDVGK
jgi:hypothetical protein